MTKPGPEAILRAWRAAEHESAAAIEVSPARGRALAATAVLGAVAAALLLQSPDSGGNLLRAGRAGGLMGDQRDSHMQSVTTIIGAATVAIPLALSANASAQQGAAVQWRVEDGGNGHWYAIGEPTQRHVDAVAAATASGGLLTSLETQKEQDWVLVLGGFPEGNQGAWIGLIEAASGWGWMSGAPLGGNTWLPGNPCGACDEPVGMLFRNSQWGTGLADTALVACCTPYPRPIIEWSADCNNDGIVDYGQVLDGAFPDQDQNNVPDCCDNATTCVPRECGDPIILLQDAFDDATLNGTFWSTYLPFGCSRAEQRDGAVEFQDRGHLQSRGDFPIGTDGIEIKVGFTYVAGAEFFDTVVMTDTSTVGGAIANGLLLTFTSYPGFDPFIIHASSNFQLGTAIKSGSVAVAPGDTFEAVMRISPGIAIAELRNTKNPSEVFRVERSWTGSPAGHKMVWYNREFCEHRTNLNSVEITRMIPVGPDCDTDGISDACEIQDGAADLNQNGIPDLCEVPTCADADLNPNGAVDGADLGAMLAFWGPVSPAFPRADINGDGNVNGADLGILLSVWGPCGG